MTPKPRIPRVAVLIETSRAFGRGVIEGIARYVRDCGPWSIQFEERGLEDPPPRWLKNWPGDGIIARTVTAAMAKAIRAAGSPTVELLRGEYSAVDNDPVICGMTDPPLSSVSRIAGMTLVFNDLKTGG